MQTKGSELIRVNAEAEAKVVSFKLYLFSVYILESINSKNVLINDFPQSQGSQTQGIRYHMVEFRRQNRHVRQRFFSDLV